MLKTLTRKFILISAVVALFMAVNFYFIYSFTSVLKGNAARINYIGNLRFRSFEAAWIADNIAESLTVKPPKNLIPELQYRISLIDRIISDIRTGGDNNTKPVKSRKAINMMGQISDDWNKMLKPDLLAFVKLSGDKSEAYKRRLLVRFNSRIQDHVKKIDGLVNFLTEESEREIHKFTIFRNYAIVAFMLIAFFTAFYLRNSLIIPLWRLKAGVNEVGKGRLGSKIEVKGNDEIADLSRRFNSMSQSLDASFREQWEAKERFRNLMENVPAGISLTTPEGRILEINSTMLDIYGYESKDEMLKLAAHDLYYDPADREKIFAILEKGSVKDLEQRRRRKDGTPFWISFNSVPQKNDDGSLVFINAVQDITERKCAEEELEKKVEERTNEIRALSLEYKKLFDAIEQSGESVLITDRDSKIQYVNPMFSEISGYSREEALGKTPSILSSGMNPPGTFKKMWKAILAGQVWKGTVINRKKTGSVYYEDMTVAPVHDEQGKVINFVAVKKDATDRVRAEEEIKKKNKELIQSKMRAEAANKAKSDFLANMSHELRTPLNSIIGFSEVLIDDMAGPVSDEQKDLLKDIHESGKHLLGLINDILDLSKIEAGKTNIEEEAFELAHAIEKSINMLHEMAARKKITITKEIGHGVGTITADERKIKQILINLLNNAIKFTPEGGEVTVSARQVKSWELEDGSRESGVGSWVSGDGERIYSEFQIQHSGLNADFIEISVADTGIGIKEEDMQRLFRPFEQLESHLTKRYAGTGLGLNLCKKLVEMHGGSIWAESKEGKGSTFTFVIPC